MNSRKGTNLYRGPRAIAGVCSGIADYFNVDVIIVRIAWILLSFFSAGIAAVLYLILWIVVPENPNVNKTVVDVDPVSVQSDKYHNVVNQTHISPCNTAERFGVNAGAGHIPPQPPKHTVQTACSERLQNAHDHASSFWDGNREAHEAFKTVFHPASSRGKQDTSSVGLAVLLGLGLILFFTACAHASTLILPGVHFSDFFPMIFVVLGVVIVAVPAHRWSFAMRVCGFLFCLELCCVLLPFSLGLVSLESVSSLSMFALVLWIAAACLVIISLVSPSELVVIALVLIVMAAIVVSFVDIGVFERIATLVSMNPPHKKSIPQPISVHSSSTGLLIKN